MRLLALLPLTAALAAFAPMAANAAWPPGAQQQYMNDCVATAQQSVDPAKAKAHCGCGAQVIEKQFTTAEITQLMSTNPPPTLELRQRLEKAVQVCKAS